MTNATPKFISWLLRHGLTSNELDPSGCISIELLIEIVKNKFNRNISIDWLEQIVMVDSKQRFEIIEKRIRAVQGHSIKGVNPTLSMELVENPSLVVGCFHATYKKHISSILENGLQPITRNCVHLALDKSLCRPSSELIIIIDVEKFYKAGHRLFRASNGVLCFNGIIKKEFFLDIIEF